MVEKISITICGDGGCGKSSITLRLVRSQWTHEYDPTIEDSYSVTRTVDGLPYFLSLTDTAGQEEYRGLWAASNLKSDAFLLVYDITNGASLDTLDYFMEMIDIETEQRMEENQRRIRAAIQAAGGHQNRIDYDNLGLQAPPVKIVAGNKCDLKDARVITSRQGLEWARKRGCGFMETSAREMVNIEESFALIVRRVVEARRSVIAQQQNELGISILDKETGNFLAQRQAQSQQKPSFHDQQQQANISISQTAPLSPLREKFGDPDTGNKKRGEGFKNWLKKIFCFCSK